MVILQLNPPGAVAHGPNDYEFLPESHALLNQHMANRQVVPIDCLMAQVPTMRQPPTYTAWKITCRSPEEAQSLRQWLPGRIDLDRVWTETIRVTPNGVEKVQTVRHRLGDYFAALHVLPDSQADPASFRIQFQRRPDASRFWKDLMVNILQEIEGAPQTHSIELASKGEPYEPLLQKQCTHVYAIVRVDAFQRSDTPIQQQIAVTKVMHDQAAAEREVEWPNSFKPVKQSYYFCQTTRLESTSAAAPAGTGRLGPQSIVCRDVLPETVRTDRMLVRASVNTWAEVRATEILSPTGVS